MQLKADYRLHCYKSHTYKLRKSGKSTQARLKGVEILRQIHEERLKVLKAGNADYEEPELPAQSLFSTHLDDHVDRSEAYFRVISRKRSHVHFNL